MRFFAFDSFEGLPELSGVDQDTKDFAKGQYSFDEESFCLKVQEEGETTRTVARLLYVSKALRAHETELPAVTSTTAPTVATQGAPTSIRTGEPATTFTV